MTTNPSAIIDIPKGINSGLSSPSNKTLLQILGMPRDTVDRTCRAVTNQPLKSLITLTDIGPFRVTGLKPAVASLKRIMKDLKKDLPKVYETLGTAGMCCVRLIGGSAKLSNHSWGCAIDISISGTLDGLGSTKRDGKTLAGLAAMAPYFHAEGWYWGVGFSNFEDGMHFEIAEETLRKWHADGKLGKKAGARTTTPRNISRGDIGEAVKEIQHALAKKGYDIVADGNFGPITEGIVVDFQSKNGLVPDGIVGPVTRTALLD